MEAPGNATIEPRLKLLRDVVFPDDEEWGSIALALGITRVALWKWRQRSKLPNGAPKKLARLPGYAGRGAELRRWIDGAGTDDEMPQPSQAPAEAADLPPVEPQARPDGPIQAVRDGLEDCRAFATGIASALAEAMRGGPQALEAAAPVLYRQMLSLPERMRPLSHTPFGHNSGVIGA